MSERAGWGILGTGGSPTSSPPPCRLRHPAVSSLSAAAMPRRPRRSPAEFGIERSHGSYAALLDDPAVEFVYVATPHPTHVELAARQRRAGKHVLCEKPIAPSAAGAAIAIEAARAGGRVPDGGLRVPLHPQTSGSPSCSRAARSVSSAIGQCLASGFDAGPAPTNYLFRRDLAGGAMLDNGCYPVALSRRIAGHTVGATYRDPIVSLGLACSIRNRASTSMPTPWRRTRAGSSAHPHVHVAHGGRQERPGHRLEGVHPPPRGIPAGSHGSVRRPAAHHRRTARRGASGRSVIDAPGGLYTIEADTVVGYAREGRTEAPEMTPGRTPWATCGCSIAGAPRSACAMTTTSSRRRSRPPPFDGIRSEVVPAPNRSKRGPSAANWPASGSNAPSRSRKPLAAGHASPSSTSPATWSPYDRMDGAPYNSAQHARDKAVSSAGNGVATHEMWAYVADDPQLNLGILKVAGLVRPRRRRTDPPRRRS